MPRILLTGAGGALGREIAARAAGIEIRPLGRKELDFARAGAYEPIFREAARGVDAIIHCASDPRNAAAVDVEGTRALVRAAGDAHLVYVSITGVDRSDYPYYRAKREAELLLAAAPAWTVLRATQFHGFALDRLRSLGLDEAEEVVVPEGVRFQSVDIGEVAARLLRLAAGPPLRAIQDFAGPRVMAVEEMAESYLRLRGRRARVRSAPLPGVFPPFRTGVNIPAAPVTGSVDWEEFIARG